MSGLDIEHVGALTPVQAGMLYHRLSGSDPGLYLEQGVGRLEGKFDPVILGEAWQLVVDRHAALRSAIVHRSMSRPAQVYFRRLPAPFLFLDWSNLSQQELETALEQERRDHAASLVDLERAPLLRLTAAAAGPGRMVFALSIHHLIHDAWTLELILRELFETCAALKAGRRPPTSPAPAFYRYSGLLGQSPSAEALEFFREMLNGQTPPCAPLADRGERAAGDGHCELRLAPDETQRLEAALRRSGLTLAGALGAAWGLVSARADEREEATFGLTLLGRSANVEGMDRAAGIFINTLPLRIWLERELRTAEWVRRQQALQFRLRELEQTSLTEIRSRLGLSPQKPLFENILVMQSAFAAARGIDTAGLRLAELKVHGRPHYPLMLRATPGERLWLELVHQPARVGAASAQRLLDAVVAVLLRLPDSLDDPLEDWVRAVDHRLERVPPTERRRLGLSQVRPRAVEAT